MAAFKHALHLTTATLNRRAFHHRNLVMLVVTVVLVSIGWAIVTWSASPLLGLLLLWPLCGGFFYVDARLVNRWNDDALRLWMDEDLDLGDFATTVKRMGVFPRGSLHGMLDTLPAADDPVPSSNIKRALASTARTTNRCAADRVATAVVAYGFAAAALALALEGFLLPAMVMALLIAPVLALGWWIRLARCRRWRRELFAMQDGEVMVLLGQANRPAGPNYR